MTELSLRALRTLRDERDAISGFELWIWPQDYATESDAAPPPAQCNYSMLQLPPSAFLVYTLDAGGAAVASRWEPAGMPPSRLLLPLLSVYVPPPHDVLVAYSDLRWVHMSECEDNVSIGFTCAAAANAYQWPNSTSVFVPSRTTHVFYFANSTWAAYDDGTGPITQPPYRFTPDGWFPLGFRLVYDPIDDVVLAVGGYQWYTHVPGFQPSNVSYGTVFVLDVRRWTWTTLHTTYSPDPADITFAYRPNEIQQTLISSGMLVMSTVGGKHELLAYGGISGDFVDSGGYCYVLDITTAHWRSVDSCSYPSGPFFLVDTAHAVSSDGSSVLVLGGRNYNPVWAAFVSLSVWELSLVDYLWRLQTVVTDDAFYALNAYPYTLVRASLFALPDQCNSARGCRSSGSKLIAWGGAAANKSYTRFYYQGYDALQVEPCSRYFGGQAANVHYVAMPTVLHLLTLPSVCNHAVLLIAIGDIIVIVLTLCVLSVGVLATIVVRLHRVTKLRQSDRYIRPHGRRMQIVIDMHGIFDAGAAAAWWALFAACCAAMTCSTSTACGMQAYTTNAMSLYQAVGLCTVRLLLLPLLAGLMTLPPSGPLTCKGAQRCTCCCSGPSSERFPPAWSPTTSVLSYRVAAGSSVVRPGLVEYSVQRVVLVCCVWLQLLMQPVAFLDDVILRASLLLRDPEAQGLAAVGTEMTDGLDRSQHAPRSVSASLFPSASLSYAHSSQAAAPAGVHSQRPVNSSPSVTERPGVHRARAVVQAGEHASDGASATLFLLLCMFSYSACSGACAAVALRTGLASVVLVAYRNADDDSSEVTLSILPLFVTAIVLESVCLATTLTRMTILMVGRVQSSNADVLREGLLQRGMDGADNVSGTISSDGNASVRMDASGTGAALDSANATVTMVRITQQAESISGASDADSQMPPR